MSNNNLVEIEIKEYPDEVYEKMFDGFSEEEKKIIFDFMDTYFPINNDDWTK
jgi:hypothetical protein